MVKLHFSVLLSLPLLGLCCVIYRGNLSPFVFLSDVKFEIDLPKKLVWIESDRDVDVLLETLKKCGKEVKYNGTK